jgi:hypothetical protein
VQGARARARRPGAAARPARSGWRRVSAATSTDRPGDLARSVLGSGGSADRCTGCAGGRRIPLPYRNSGIDPPTVTGPESGIPGRLWRSISKVSWMSLELWWFRDGAGAPPQPTPCATREAAATPRRTPPRRCAFRPPPSATDPTAGPENRMRAPHPSPHP